MRDVTDRRTAEQQRLLVAGEVAHRLRNTMAVVGSIVSLTARGAASLPEFIRSLNGRFTAISRTNDVLIGGKGSTASLRELLLSELAAFQNDGDRIALIGPDVRIDGKLALDLALILHELATNAAKYGALSVVSGAIKVNWHLSSDQVPVLEIWWRESGGPPVVIPEKKGFGSMLMERALRPHGGHTRLTYTTDGVCCAIVFPLLVQMPDGAPIPVALDASALSSR